MTDLYLIRHGIAAERGTYENDDQRPLTPEGDRKTHQIATRLKQLNLQFDHILTSPLIRARQTADILKTVGLSSQVEECAALAPDGNIQDWITWYQTWQSTGGKSLALVGHQPDLGHWAELLIWGQPKGALIVKKAGIIGITLPPTSVIGNSQLFWLTPPRFLLP
ncbi:MAG TPA: phosphohistidine phosphatase SixA [Oscillatoriales bacterium UBA8482]|nr:MAG: phosphohistidine phosphatase SixA [Oscillatoriales cyanobacterium CG2_30_40_61]HBW57031.1 phosphohistidine phosphatase SixA [Oscillatoriales bacterium UBA8482]